MAGVGLCGKATVTITHSHKDCGTSSSAAATGAASARFTRLTALVIAAVAVGVVVGVAVLAFDIQSHNIYQNAYRWCFADVSLWHATHALISAMPFIGGSYPNLPVSAAVARVLGLQPSSCAAVALSPPAACRLRHIFASSRWQFTMLIMPQAAWE